MKISSKIQNEGLYSGMPTLFVEFDSMIQNKHDPEIARQIIKESQNGLGLHQFSNGLYNWHHPLTGNRSQLCFTGEDPMMFQETLNDICLELDRINACPPQITIETNASKPIKKLNIMLLTQHLHFCCCPKFNDDYDMHYHALESYFNECDTGEIKFVHDGSNDVWNEIDVIMNNLTDFVNAPEWTFWIIPQNDSKTLIKEAMIRGFNVSSSFGLKYA